MTRWILSLTGFLAAACVLAFFGVRGTLGFGLAVASSALVSAGLMHLRGQAHPFSQAVMNCGVELLLSSLAVLVFSVITGDAVGLPVVGGWILGLICARAAIDHRADMRVLLLFVLFWGPALFWLDGERRQFVAAMALASGAGVLTPWIVRWPQWLVWDGKLSRGTKNDGASAVGN